MFISPGRFSTLDDVIVGTRFLLGLPTFLRHPLTLEQAEATLRSRLENRESDFLSLLKEVVYPNLSGPYRQLLDIAGCEYGDLEKMVGQEGVEGSLQIIFRNGVYLTVDEFKNKCPVVRGSSTFRVDPKRWPTNGTCLTSR